MSLKAKLLVPAVMLGVGLSLCSSKAQVPALGMAKEKIEAKISPSPACGPQTALAAGLRRMPVDSLYLSMMRAAFLDEINCLRAKFGPTPPQRTPLKTHARFNKVGQHYADTLATLPAGLISHDVTGQAERLSWLRPFAKSNQECIQVEGVIRPVSLSDTAGVLQAVRLAARNLFNSDEAHRNAILRPSPGHGLGGVGLVLSESAETGRLVETPAGLMEVNCGGLRLVAVLEVGGYPCEPSWSSR